MSGSGESWWRTDWTDVLVKPRADLVVVPVGSLAVGVRPGQETVVLEELQILCLTGPTDGTRVGDLAGELRRAGFPATEDADALVANTAAALHEAGLATLSLRPATAPPAPPASFTARRSLRHVPFQAHAARPAQALPPAAPLTPEPRRARESARSAGRVPADVLGISGGWLRFVDGGVCLIPESREADIPDTASWHAHLWLTDDGSMLVIPPATDDVGTFPTSDECPDAPTDLAAWRFETLASIDVPASSGVSAELAAITIDELGASAPGASRSLVHLIVTMAEAGVIRHHAPWHLPTPELATPPLVTAFASVGTLEPQARSVKIAPGRIEPGRATWSMQLDCRDDPTRKAAARKALEAFALPAEAASKIVALDGHDGRLILGVEPESHRGDERRKVYVLIDEVETWDDLRASWPTLDALHRDSVLFPGVPPGSPPQFVAWKRRGSTDAATLSVYRRAVPDQLTVSDALDRVLASFPTWADAIRAFLVHDRDPGDLLTEDDLEVIEVGGRHSIDLGVADPSPRGARIAAGRALLRLAGSSDPDGKATAVALARLPVFRIIAGTDASSHPFFSVYSG